MSNSFLGRIDGKNSVLKKQILKLCINEGDYSLADLSKELNTSIPTITKLVGELIEDGFEDLKKCVRIWPHKMNGEGHFIALLRKKEKADEVVKKAKPRKEKALPALLEEFMKDCTYPINGSDIEIQEDRVYLMPEGIKGIKGLRFLRSGLLLGTLTKDRFEPSQAFAMVLKKDQYKAVIDLSSIDHRVIRYLKGETIEVDDLPLRRQKGWQLVCVDGFPLGWGKLVNGSLRNKYLPGWRWQS